MSNDFFAQLNFSSSNEDSRSELRALRLTASDSVLCITGSGARPLDLLLDAPARVVSIDLNPTQNFLFELKRCAFRRLAHEELLAFLGARPSRARASTYRGLRAELPAETRTFFDARPELIARGVLFAGTWERYLGLLCRAIRPLRGHVIDALFAAPDVQAQAALWERAWDTPAWRLFLRMLALRGVWKYVLVEPGVRFIADDFSIYDYFRRRLHHAAHTFLLRESPFASLMFRGAYDDERSYPPHLRPEAFARVRERLACVEVVTADLRGYLARRERFDAFSLSDFGSYADLASYRAVWDALAGAAQPGARVCERQFMVKRDPSRWLSDRLARAHTLEAELERVDNAFIYSFVIGELKP